MLAAQTRRTVLRAAAGMLAAGPAWTKTRDARSVDVALEARAASVEVAGRRVELLTYNGGFPGPLLRAREGDRLRVLLVNRLDEPTNLHFHGLHVSPSGNSDNIFVEVPPGGEFLYELTVPNGYGGTFWYHPHRHHHLARQLWRGLAGPLVIDPVTAPPSWLAAADEQVVVIKDLSVVDGRPAPHTTGDWARGKTGPLLFANGMIRPVITAGSTFVRLRLVNACNARILRLARADGAPCRLIAHEGHLLEVPREVTELVVTPAQRVDLLLDLEPGVPVQLVAKPYNSGARRDPSAPEELLTLVAAAGPVATPAAGRLALVERLEPEAVAVRRSFRMAMAFLTADGHGHMEPISARLGDLECWEIRNVDTQDHVFHLHTWPFQVWRRDGVEPPYRAWRDTINLEPGERVEILIPFRDFAGRSVFHCHIAEHGDAGMMGIVEVIA
jgi:FtsP/CotA-like multicopper oxidase with cupredoxin domain